VLLDEIEEGAKSNNYKQLKGALAESEIGARPEYINELSKARQQITTNYGKKTDADFVLKNNKFLNIKNDQSLITATKSSTPYQQFADELDTMLTYQIENRITTGVEIASKTQLSDDVIKYLQKLKDSGQNISWRVIE